MSAREKTSRKSNACEPRARELAIQAGIDPDSRIVKPGSPRGMPAWCGFIDQATAEYKAKELVAASQYINQLSQPTEYQNSPLRVFGEHEAQTIEQMRNCMKVGNVVAGVICADGHLGYAQPVGGVIAYENQVSISGCGFDIGCGCMGAKLDIKYKDIIHQVPEIAKSIAKIISFGIGRKNEETVDHPLFDDHDAWRTSGMEYYKSTARRQLGTVGSGNHYVDLLCDEQGFVWIGVHFGSRGLGHSTASKYLELAGGKDGIHVAPAIVDTFSEVGMRYLIGMELAGTYACAGRNWVVERVRQIIGGTITDTVHNHHNYAWNEPHTINGEIKSLMVVRKGATPLFPGQRGFVGGSMGDNAVIIQCKLPLDNNTLNSTIHGAGRVFGRMAAKRKFTREQMHAWLRERQVTLIGGDLDESPMAYRRLADVLTYHANSIDIVHQLQPFVVVMAGSDEYDPFKD